MKTALAEVRGVDLNVVQPKEKEPGAYKCDICKTAEYDWMKFLKHLVDCRGRLCKEGASAAFGETNNYHVQSEE